MMIAVVVGLVPLLYLYARRRFNQQEPTTQNKIVFWVGFPLLAFVMWITFPSVGIGVGGSALVSIIIALMITWFVFWYKNMDYKIEQEQGLGASCMFTFKFAVIMLILNIIAIIWKLSSQ